MGFLQLSGKSDTILNAEIFNIFNMVIAKKEMFIISVYVFMEECQSVSECWTCENIQS